MLYYNESNYLKPYPSSQSDLEEKQKKFFHSTASMSSNNSQSNLSTSKYSFKTGTLKNIYTQKHHPQEGPSSNLPLKHNNFTPSFRTFQSSVTPANKLSDRQMVNFSRSKSQNTSVSKFRPLVDPKINCYSHNNSILICKNVQNWGLARFERKRQVQKQNMMLKKSVSQKRLHFEQHFSTLNIKIGFLKNQYKNQEQKMARITAIISEYFA